MEQLVLRLRVQDLVVEGLGLGFGWCFSVQGRVWGWGLGCGVFISCLAV